MLHATYSRDTGKFYVMMIIDTISDHRENLCVYRVGANRDLRFADRNWIVNRAHVLHEQGLANVIYRIEGRIVILECNAVARSLCIQLRDKEGSTKQSIVFLSHPPCGSGHCRGTSKGNYSIQTIPVVGTTPCPFERREYICTECRLGSKLAAAPTSWKTSSTHLMLSFM